MDRATNLVGEAPINEKVRGQWSSQEEDRLFRLVRSENLSGRTTTATWEKIADRLAASGMAQGFKRRSASSVRHRASLLKAYDRNGVASEAAPAPVVQQTFAAPEVKAEVSRALVATLRRIADEMEHGA